MEKKERFVSLDGLRGIAALSVVLYHYVDRYDVLYGHKKDFGFSMVLGQFGLPLFFLISGFVIFFSLTRAKSAKDFIIKRATVLYPVYTVAVVMIFAILAIFPLQGRDAGLIHLVVSLTMLTPYIPGDYFVDGAHWTMALELTFYGLMAVLLFLKRLHLVYWLCVLWLVSATSVRGLGYLLPNKISDVNSTLLLMTWCCHLFIAGIMFSRLYKNMKDWKYHAMLGATLVYDLAFEGFAHMGVIFTIYTVFYGILLGKANFLAIRPLVFLGSISYSLYLVHQNIGYIVIRFIESKGIVGAWSLVIPISISIGLACLLTFYVDKPIQKAIRKWLARDKGTHMRTSATTPENNVAT